LPGSHPRRRRTPNALGTNHSKRFPSTLLRASRPV
jgi:hypothetical protein